MYSALHYLATPLAALNICLGCIHGEEEIRERLLAGVEVH